MISLTIQVDAFLKEIYESVKGEPDLLIVHVGTNDLTNNIVVGNVDFLTTAERKIDSSYSNIPIYFRTPYRKELSCKSRVLLVHINDDKTSR